jgi:hypothetical protein
MVLMVADDANGGGEHQDEREGEFLFEVGVDEEESERVSKNRKWVDWF